MGTSGQRPRFGNPIPAGRGICDPHVRICNDRAYPCAAHTWNGYIARLHADRISPAEEEPRLIRIGNPEGTYGKGRTGDKKRISP